MILIIKYAVGLHDEWAFNNALDLYFQNELLYHKISLYCRLLNLFQSEDATTQLMDCYPNNPKSSLT